MTTPRVEFATLDDIPAPIALQRRVYPTISPWTQAKLEQQLTVFGQGQIVARAGGDVIGYAGSLIVSWDQWADAHTWKEITASGSFQTHDPRGRTLYGAEVFVAPEAQGSISVTGTVLPVRSLRTARWARCRPPTSLTGISVSTR
jgi:hypothetical protein